MAKYEVFYRKNLLAVKDFKNKEEKTKYEKAITERLPGANLKEIFIPKSKTAIKNKKKKEAETVEEVKTEATE